MHQTAPFKYERPLFVHVAGGAYHHVFELDSAEERAFLVGSSRSADLCIDRVGVAAVEFHVERVRGEVWLVPGYRGGGVLVNGVPLTTRRRVDARLIVDLGAVSLELYASEDETAPGAARSSSAPRPLPADYGASLPTDTACTAIALTPVIAGVGEASTDASEDDPLLKTQPLAVVRPPVLTEQRTERMAPVFVPPTLLQQTQRLPPVRPVPTIVVRAAEPPPAPAPAPDAFAALTAQETTAFDVEACVPAEPQRSVAPSAPPSPAPSVAPPRPPTAGKRPLRLSGGPLEQLGLLTKARPAWVLGGGLAAALLTSLALVGAMQLTGKRSEPISAASAAPRAAAPASASARPAVVSPVVSSAPVAVAPPPAPTGSARGARTTDAELVAAVSQLAAGRLGEAAQSYRQLSARPEGAEVYGKLATLLARSSGANCAAKSTPSAITCPELLK